MNFETDIFEFPEFEAEWAPVYLEPIVESGERITVGIVATDGHSYDARITVTDKAIQCLYGNATDGIKSIIKMAMSKSLKYAESGFDTSCRSGIHGIHFGKPRLAYGEDLSDVIDQGAELSSSLSRVHAEIASGRDRSAYWRRVKNAMETVDSKLVPFFGRQVDVSVRGVDISIPCDYFSSKLAVNVCSLSSDNRRAALFDTALSKIMKLEQLKSHDAMLEHHQSPAMMLVAPSNSQLDRMPIGARKQLEDRILLLHDMTDKKDFPLIRVTGPKEGAKEISKMESAA